MKHSQIIQFRVILLIVFLGFIGISIPYLIFPALFLNPAYSILPAGTLESTRAILLGITLAAYPLGQFIGSPILGSLSDDYGRKPILTASLLVAALCYLVTGYAIQGQYLGLLIASRFAAGLMEGNIAIARAMAADFTSLSKHKTFGKINAACSIAYLIGPFLGGLMSDKNLWGGLTATTPFYAVCLLFFALAGLAGWVLKQGREIELRARRSFWQRINLFKRIKELFSNERLRFLMITSTAFTLAVDIFYEFGPVFLTIKWSFGPVELIYFNGILCIGLAIGNGWLSSQPSDKRTRQLAVLGGTGAFAAIMMAIVLVDSYYLMLVLFGISGLFIGLAVVILTVKISDSVSNQIQGEVMGVQLSLRVLGDAIICLFGGVLLLFSPKIILVAAACLALMAMGFYAKKL
jgi:DHA1 family tetracycline resistance protein-like MFS transporter